jgi:3-methyladenine DNA glycosylase/8-oxoguanine DNA glycosylase
VKKAIRHLKESDPVLAVIIERIGILKPAYREPSFESMARAITYQQLHGSAARAI